VANAENARAIFCQRKNTINKGTPDAAYFMLSLVLTWFAGTDFLSHNQHANDCLTSLSYTVAYL
jgi:hypothetical protein